MHLIFKEENGLAKEYKASCLPGHGPLDENGREILLSLKNVDITFGKGDNAEGC